MALCLQRASYMREIHQGVWSASERNDLMKAILHAERHGDIPASLTLDNDHVYTRTRELAARILQTHTSIKVRVITASTMPMLNEQYFFTEEGMPSNTLIFVDLTVGPRRPALDALCDILKTSPSLDHLIWSSGFDLVCHCGAVTPRCPACSALIYLCRALEDNTSLLKFSLQCSTFGTGACQAVSRVLQRSRGLVELNLVNLCYVRGLSEIFPCLAGNTSLKIFRLLLGQISDGVLPYVADMLAVNHALEELDLTGCIFTAACLRPLARVLLTNTSLKKLLLPVHDATADSVQGLHDWVSVVRTNTSLRSLVLHPHHRDVDWYSDAALRTAAREVVDLLLDALEVNHTLRWLEINSLKADYDQEMRRWALLRRNWTRYACTTSLKHAVAFHLIQRKVGLEALEGSLCHDALSFVRAVHEEHGDQFLCCCRKYCYTHIG